RFDRHELAGAFGDIGTDLPLLVGLIATCGLDATSVLVLFGTMQVLTGLLYGLPMPVQPLKAMAVIMLSQKLPPELLYGGGLAIGIVMLLLTLSGGLDWLAKVVPLSVVRGIQFGLGVSLCSLALKDYVQSSGATGYLLASTGFVAFLWLRRYRHIPAALVLIGIGGVYAVVFKMDIAQLSRSLGFSLPRLHIPSQDAILQGLLVLALPQIPLSLSNSVVATNQTLRDLFPDRAVSVRRIGITYSLMNLINPLFGGVPTCHGCGGLAGFYAFGARTGGAPILYGAMYLMLGLFLSKGFQQAIQVFPMPILGVVLLFEGLGLMALLRDRLSQLTDLWLALLVAMAVVALPYGYVVGIVGGTLLHYAAQRRWLLLPVSEK
ncbi:MAG: putative sulfate/molybdate transporter, partial [bacterium]|nr:putative sulfate/molybdate transporter [bacterium]